MIIRKVDPLSAGKIAGIICAGIGLIFGVLYFLFFMAMAAVGGMAGAANHGHALFGAAFGIVGGVAMLVMIPVFYGVAGFVGGVLQAFIFNIATRYVGGLKVETE